MRLKLSPNGNLYIRDGRLLFGPEGSCCCNDGGDTGGGGGMDCDRRLFVIWESEPVDGNEIIQQGPSPIFMHTTMIEQGGASVEVMIDAEIIGLPECITNEFNDDLSFVIRSTLVSSPPHTGQGFAGNVDINTQMGDAETTTVSVTASSVNDYFGRAFVRIVHPDFGFEPRVFAVEWVYLPT